MKDSTKKGFLKGLLIATCAVVLLSSTTTAVNNVKGLFKGDDETKVEQVESGNETASASYEYAI